MNQVRKTLPILAVVRKIIPNEVQKGNKKNQIFVLTRLHLHLRLSYVA